MAAHTNPLGLTRLPGRLGDLQCATRASHLIDIFIGLHPDQSDTLGKRAAMSAEHNPFIDASAWPAFLADMGKAFKDSFG